MLVIAIASKVELTKDLLHTLLLPVYDECMANKNIPVDQFLKLNNGDNERRREIISTMQFLKGLYKEDDEGWMKATYNKIVRNDVELMFVSFVFGSYFKMQNLN